MRLLPPLFRPLDDDPPDLDDPPLLRRDEDLRALLLRPDDDFLPPRREDLRPPEDFRVLLERLLLDRLRAPPLRLLLERRPPLLRPEDPDRDRFLPPRELLDFLAAAIGMLRDGGFVEPIARFAHNNAGKRQLLAFDYIAVLLFR